MGSKDTKLFHHPLAWGGLCANVRPTSTRSTVLLHLLEPILERCHYLLGVGHPCSHPAVRVGVYAIDNDVSEFRALCSRHSEHMRSQETYDQTK